MPLMVGALLAGIVIFGAAVRAEGTTSCPDPAQVTERLAAILPAPVGDAAGAPPDRGRFWAEGGDLVIRLDGPDGAVLATRRLPLTAACADLAAAVAVSLAAWESDIHPQFAAAFTAAPAAAARVSAPAESSVGWDVELGAALGLGAALDGPALAGDAVVGGWLHAPHGTLSWRAELEGQSRRALVLPEGRAVWRRWSVGLGAEGRLFRRHGPASGGRLSWFALGRVAWLDLRGEGFPQNHTTSAVDPGATTGLRWSWNGPADRWSFGLELAASLWPIRHEAVAGGTDAAGRLPATEAFLRLAMTRGAAR